MFLKYFLKIAEQSAPSLGRWTESYVLPCMPVFGCTVCRICRCYTSAIRSYTGEYTEDFRLYWKGNSWRGDFKKTHTHQTMARPGLEIVINEEETSCRFEDRGKKTGCTCDLRG